MSYNPVIWVNGETPINDANLNNMDQGILAAHEILADHEKKIDDFANQQLPEEYVKSAVDEYVNENSGGFATATALAETKESLESKTNQLSSEIVELQNVTRDYYFKEFALANGENAFDVSANLKTKTVLIENKSSGDGFFRVLAFQHANKVSQLHDETNSIKSGESKEILLDYALGVRWIYVENINNLGNACVSIYNDTSENLTNISKIDVVGRLESIENFIDSEDNNTYLVNNQTLTSGENDFVFDVLDCKSVKIVNNSTSAGFFRIRAYSNEVMTSLLYDNTFSMQANTVYDTKDIVDIPIIVKAIKIDNINNLPNVTTTIYVDHSKDGRMYRVEKDGTGDFVNLSDAIKVATRYMDSVVYVGKGTYDLLEELGSEYIETINVGNRGLYLKNRVHLVFASDSEVTCNYNGTNENVQTWLAPFNSGIYGFAIENADIKASNCRYAFHDERDSDADIYTNKFINCNMYIDNSAIGKTGELCIGGGLGVNGHIVIEGCRFNNKQNVSSSAFYHNSAGVGKNRIDLRDSYFGGTTSFNFDAYGDSTEVSKAYISGCSFGSAVKLSGTVIDATNCDVESGNVGILAWNNTIRQ